MSANIPAFPRHGNVYADLSVTNLLESSNKGASASKSKCSAGIVKIKLFEAVQQNNWDNDRQASECTDSTVEPDFSDISESEPPSGRSVVRRHTCESQQTPQCSETRQRRGFENVKVNKETPNQSTRREVAHRHICEFQQTPQFSDTRQRRGFTNVKVTKETPNQSTPPLPGPDAATVFGSCAGASSREAPVKPSRKAVTFAPNVAVCNQAFKHDRKSGQRYNAQEELFPTYDDQCLPRPHLMSSRLTAEDSPMPTWEVQVDRFVQIVSSALLQGFMKADDQVDGPTEPRSFEHHADQDTGNRESSQPMKVRSGGQPMKVHTPYMESTASGLIFESPIKKCVPDWARESNGPHATPSGGEFTNVWNQEQILTWLNSALGVTAAAEDPYTQAKTFWREWSFIEHHVPSKLRTNIVKSIDANLSARGLPALREIVGETNC